MSLRARLTLLLVSGIGLPLVLGGLLLCVFVPAWLRHELDRSLEARAKALATLTKETAGVVELDFADELMPEFDSDEDPYYFELWLGDGTLVERSRSFQPTPDERRPDLARATGVTDEPRHAAVTLPDGREGRQVQVDFVPEDTIADAAEEAAEEEESEEEDLLEEDDPHARPTEVLAAGGTIASIVVAGGTERLDGQVATIRIGTALVTILLLVGLTATVRFALRVGLRPIDGIVGQVASMEADSLGQRIDTSHAPAELVPLLDQINDFIERLARAFRRERQLTADIAHELKTPIAELRSLSEVGERWPDDRAAVVSFFADARTVACQMERVVVNLLALARHDAGQQAVRADVVEILPLIEAAWRPLAPAAEARGMVLRIDVQHGLRATTDAEKLGLMVANLLSNAVAHGRADTVVTCSAVPDGDGVLICVTNETVDLEQADLRVMFDRFWRKDKARTGGASAGLGLALVRALADVLGIEVRTFLALDRTFRIELRVPESIGAGTARGPSLHVARGA
jgi:two-component system sensor histidine kinase QseC